MDRAKVEELKARLASLDAEDDGFDINAYNGPDIQDTCPGVSIDLIRSVLKRLKGTSVECLGRGHTAKWKNIGK